MNKILKLLVFTAFTCFVQGVMAQDIKGVVYEKHQDGHKHPLPGANVHWANTTIGVATDAKGNFGINRVDGYNRLVVSYIGYRSDTLTISPHQRRLEVVLEASRELQGTEIVARQSGAFTSTLTPIVTQFITQGELQKAACCNLSESFETNASVDVSYADAVTGAKQIQLLGIPGKYSQMTFENIPNMRGLSSTYGLMYVPGPWMQSIQVAKGAASVTYGFESMSGQINVEYKKPDESEKLHLNVFLSDAGQVEANANAAVKVNNHWSTGVLAHVSKTNRKMDHNGDSFLDHPLTEQINLMNRWNYNGKSSEAKLGFRVLSENRQGGQLLDIPENATNTGNPYIIDIRTRHAEVFSKTGWISQQRASTSVGWINNALIHKRDALYGNRHYEGMQKSFYSNLIMQSYINNTAHMFTTGVSLVYDDYDEKLADSAFAVREIVPGSFFEYTYNNFDRLVVIAGLRADHHNKFGWFATPRLHMRYVIDSNTTVRASAGVGHRSAHILAENNQLLATSRRIIILDQPTMERAVNYGVNLTRNFHMGGSTLTINAEAYRTSFTDQVIVDMDQSASAIYIYNLEGKAYANSFQVEVTWDPVKNLDVVLAYRLSDVKVTQNDELVRKPLVNRYKGLVSLSYATNLRKWQFDFTSQFNGDTRLPSTAMNPPQYRLGDTAPAYVVMNAQVTKFFRKWNIYLGAENLTDYVQKNPIIAANDPFGNYFDSSLIWGPILGRKIYGGIRYTIE